MKNEFSSVSKLISQQAVKQLRRAIIEADGNEVFFGANINNDGLIETVEILARGNKASVPAIINSSMEYDVAVHNHPSGQLTPSDADIAIASEIGNASVGSYIINNDISEIYVVVPAIVETPRVELDISEILYMFTPEGSLAKLLPKYEYRHEQTVMTEKVMAAFNGDKHLLVEAGTGVGKSMAYLVPTIMWLKDNGGRIVISTNTINLQQQVLEKDLPPLIEALAPELKFMIVKGRGNYVCVKKVKDFLSNEDNGQGKLDFDDRTLSFVRDINDWINEKHDGSVNDLNYQPRSEEWELVRSEKDTCFRMNCKHNERCFYYRMKKLINKSNILIVNHHILCAELSIYAESMGRHRFLPRYNKVIIDEAHNFEESASRYFGGEGSIAGFNKNLSLVYRSKGRRGKKQSGFAYALMRFIEKNALSIGRESYDEINELFYTHLLGSYANFKETLDKSGKKILDFCRRHLKSADKNNFRFRISEKFNNSSAWQKEGLPHFTSMSKAAYSFTKAADDFKDKLVDICMQCSLEEPKEAMLPFISYSGRIKEINASLSAAANFNEDEMIRWMEVSLSSKGMLFVKWHLTPIEVGEYLRDHLFNRFETAVLTSATFTVNNKFDYFENRLGLKYIEEDRLIRKALQSPFNFEQHAKLFLANDMPIPGESGAKQFDEATARYIINCIDFMRGRCFVLFTSNASMNSVYQKCVYDLRAMNVNIIKQGDEPRKVMIKKFKDNPHNVLFGLASFWEGVDVPGDALQMIIIPKLPFTVPTEPIAEARQEHLLKNGKNPFIEYNIPLAVIKFKQGFGRLIRGTEDRGVAFVLDKRIISKNYGLQFLRSLPEMEHRAGNRQELMNALESFFDY